MVRLKVPYARPAHTMKRIGHSGKIAMGLQGKAALVGAAQYKPEKYASAPRMFHLDQVAELAGLALADAGLTLRDLDGLVVHGPQFHEAGMFVPAMVGEHLGVQLDFAEVIDLGGASSVGAVWRAAAAIELGLCSTVLCVIRAAWRRPRRTTTTWCR